MEYYYDFPARVLDGGQTPPASLSKIVKEEEGIPTGTAAYCGHERSHTNTTGPSGRGCRAQAHGTRVLARTENGNATEATKGGFGLDGCSRRWLYAPGRVSPARQGGVERRGRRGRRDRRRGTKPARPKTGYL